MDNLEKIKKSIQNFFKSVIQFMVRHKKASLLISLLLLLTLLVAFVIVPQTKQGIRNNQVEALVMRPYQNNKKIEYIPYGQLKETIVAEKEISVALVDVNDDHYKQLEKALNSQTLEENYTGKLYFYPLIYDQKEMSAYFKLDQGLTFIQFVDSVEQHRFSLNDEVTIEYSLVDYLNNLPSAHLEEQLDEELDEETTQTTSSSEEPEEDIIDELKDLNEEED